jgi:hypothetical protein
VRELASLKSAIELLCPLCFSHVDGVANKDDISIWSARKLAAVKMEKRGLEAEVMDPRKPKWDL